MTEKQKQRVLERVRRAIESSELSRYAIAKRAGISEASLSRFMRGGSLSIETVEKIAPELGLELVLQPRRKK